MSTTFETYDDVCPPGWSPEPSAQERAFAEALWREYPPGCDPYQDADREQVTAVPFSELDLVAAVAGPADPFDLVLLDALDPT